MKYQWIFPGDIAYITKKCRDRFLIKSTSGLKVVSVDNNQDTCLIQLSEFEFARVPFVDVLSVKGQISESKYYGAGFWNGYADDYDERLGPTPISVYNAALSKEKREALSVIGEIGV